MCKLYGEMCRRPSSKESQRGGPSSDEVMTGLNHNLITQRFKLNNKVALITGAATAPTSPLSLLLLYGVNIDFQQVKKSLAL